jgi:hypothetical protein
MTRMDRAERALYHQIHPAKIATDLTAEVVSTVLLWQHRLVPGLVVRLVPPAVTSAILMERTSDLVHIRDSAAGRFLRDHMSPGAQATRALGDVATAVGAWQRRSSLLLLGWAMIAAGWLAGAVAASVRRPR